MIRKAPRIDFKHAALENGTISSMSDNLTSFAGKKNVYFEDFLVAINTQPAMFDYSQAGAPQLFVWL